MVSREAVDILLVDDQPSRLLTYEAILEPLGHRFVAAGSGREALQRLMEREFAVILLDVSMPEMDGFETAQLIHQHPRFESTPIIFVTGVHLSELDRLKGYEVGAVDYVYGGLNEIRSADDKNGQPGGSATHTAGIHPAIDRDG